MKRLIRLAIVAALLLPPLVPSKPSAADVADQRCEQFMQALSAGNFNAAAAIFNQNLRGTISPEVLSNNWTGVTTGSGKLLKWEITGRSSNGKIDKRILTLTFEEGPGLQATIGVNKSDGKISQISFVTPSAEQGTPEPLATPAPYIKPSAFHSQQVTVGPAATGLPGTITVPSGKGRFPGVVLIAGAGAVDRDEKVGTNSPFKDLAEGLSSLGIAVLRYDKRIRVYYRKVDFKHLTVDADIVSDAVAAVDLMKHRPDVDPHRVYVIGHGLGAVLAPEIAEKAQVAGVMLLAPSARPLPQMIVSQNRYLNQASPQQVAEIETKANLLMAGKMKPDEMFFGAPASYYTDLNARDEIAIARKLRIPILILHGGRDQQVLDSDIRKWQEGLKGTPNVKVETFPSLNHFFIATSQKDTGLGEFLEPGHVDPGVIEAIAKFVGVGGSK